MIDVDRWFVRDGLTLENDSFRCWGDERRMISTTRLFTSKNELPLSEKSSFVQSGSNGDLWQIEPIAFRHSPPTCTRRVPKERNMPSLEQTSRLFPRYTDVSHHFPITIVRFARAVNGRMAPFSSSPPFPSYLSIPSSSKYTSLLGMHYKRSKG